MLTDRCKAVLGSGLGLGLLPWVPGSFGALIGLAWHWVVWRNGGPLGLSVRLWCLIGALLFAFIHYRLTRWAQRYWGEPDPKHFVLDEIVGYLCVPLFTPFPFTSGWHLLIAFLLFRLLDAIKLPGARYIDQTIHNAHGVLCDDIISAFYTALLMGSLLYLLTR